MTTRYTHIYTTHPTLKTRVQLTSKSVKCFSKMPQSELLRRAESLPMKVGQDGFHLDPASYTQAQLGALLLQPQPRFGVRRRHNSYLDATSTDLLAWNLHRPAINHIGQPTTSHPEARSRRPGKIPVAQAIHNTTRETDTPSAPRCRQHRGP